MFRISIVTVLLEWFVGKAMAYERVVDPTLLSSLMFRVQSSLFYAGTQPSNGCCCPHPTVPVVYCLAANSWRRCRMSRSSNPRLISSNLCILRRDLYGVWRLSFSDPRVLSSCLPRSEGVLQDGASLLWILPAAIRPYNGTQLSIFVVGAGLCS